MKAASGNAELDALAGAAATADAGNIPDSAADAGNIPDSAQETSAVSPPVDPAAEWAQLPTLFGSIVGTAWPELQPVYSEAACLEWGRKMVPLAAKYGWNVSEVFSWLGPWIGVAMATWPLAVPTVRVMRARIAAGKVATPPAPEKKPDNVTELRPVPDTTDPDLRDPTTTNRPPRP